MISDVNFMKFGRLIRSQYFNVYLIQRFQIKRETHFYFLFFCIMVILLSLIFLNTLCKLSKLKLKFNLTL